MKKILGILGIAMIATAMFFSANNVNSFGSDITLGSLINMNTANAQGGETNEPTKYTRYFSSDLECFKVIQGVVVSNGTHVVCGSFETEDPNLGLDSCTGTDCP